MSRRSPATNNEATEAYRLGRWFTAVRRQGILARFTPEQWQTLCAMLSFTSRDGSRSFTLDQLALSLAISRDKARSRLDELAQEVWEDQPLLTIQRDLAGEVAGASIAAIESLSRVAPPEALAAAQSPPEATTNDLHGALAAVGLNPAQIEWLIHRYPSTHIQRQLDWLPERQARNPAAMLIRAVEQDWAAPKEDV